MSKNKKKKDKNGLLKRIWKRIIEANKGGPTQTGKIDLKQQQWPK